MVEKKVTALTGIIRSMKNWIKTQNRKGGDTSADAVWSHIKTKYSYLNAHEREVVFQECEDHKWI